MRRLYLRFYLTPSSASLVAVRAASPACSGICSRRRDRRRRVARRRGVLAQNVLPPADATAGGAAGRARAARRGPRATSRLFCADRRRGSPASADRCPARRPEPERGGWMRWRPPGRHGPPAPTAACSWRAAHRASPLGRPCCCMLALARGCRRARRLSVVRRLTAGSSACRRGVESLGAGDLAARVAVEGHDEVAAPRPELQSRGRAHRGAGLRRTRRCSPTPRTNCARR